MLNTLSRRLFISHLIPVLLLVPLMGFAFEFLLGTHAISTSPGDPTGETICAHFQTLATPFAGVIFLGLAFGSLVAGVLARAADQPLQMVIRDVISLARNPSRYPIKESGPQEIQDLIRAINILSREDPEIGAMNQSFNSKPVELSQWFPQALEIWRGWAKASHLDWDAVIPANLPTLMVNQSQLKPIVDCLLQNAILSTAPGGKISVHFKVVNELVCIKIDNGMTSHQVSRFSTVPKNCSGDAHLCLENVSDQENAFTLLLPLKGT